MSVTQRSNRPKSDFSISKILSDCPTTIHHDEHEKETKSSVKNFPPENGRIQTENKEILSKCCNIGEKSCTMNSDCVRVISTENSMETRGRNIEDIERCEERKSNDHLRSGDFQWLQCTRYQPPQRSHKQKRSTRKPSKHPRVPFTTFQLNILENKFLNNAYLTRKDVQQLSNLLSLPHSRVKIWFQNRRARSRRENNGIRELYTESEGPH